ncbi:Kinesin-like protein unc-104 [Diplonema papillatum]|nr:Kinesin-like protein unc-104 [Diplonema papillatum]
MPPAAAGNGKDKDGKKDWRQGTDCSVKVFLRVRPFNNKERQELGVQAGEDVDGNMGCNADNALVAKSVIHCRGPTSCTVVRPTAAAAGGKNEGLFHFDKIFNTVAPGQGSQDEVFSTIGAELLDAAMMGYNVCLLAYGQTGSGKTYTMTGGDMFKDRHKRGVIPRFLDGLFSRMQDKEVTNANCHFKLEAGYMEIYNEQVKDLLNPARGKKLQVREHPTNGPFAEGLLLKAILNPSAILHLLETGNKARHVRATNMNDFSSRSHCILQLVLTQYITSEPENEDDEPETSTIVSKINLVDLAGSERSKKTGVEGEGKKEAIHINTALHCLRKVVDALTARKVPPPQGALRALQRESILTWLLADSFGGNAKTVLIATASPAEANYVETVSTLKYASAAREIENVVKVNSDGQTAVIRALEEEVERLMSELNKQDKAKRQKEMEEAIQEQERLLLLLEESSQTHSIERAEMERKLRDVEDAKIKLESELTNISAVGSHTAKQLQQQVQEARAQLKSAHTEQNRAVRHQNEMTVELQEMRRTCEGAKQQILQIERNYSRELAGMVKGQDKFKKLIEAATKPAKSKGGGPNDPTAAELVFTRLQNETMQATMDMMNGCLTDAYKENARLVAVLNGAMNQIADYENKQLNLDDKDASIRRLQQVLHQANQKEEKYLCQLRDLSFDHLMLKQKYMTMRNGAGAGTSIADLRPHAPAQNAQNTQYPRELMQACELFGFRDPVEFSKWAVTTIGGQLGGGLSDDPEGDLGNLHNMAFDNTIKTNAVAKAKNGNGVEKTQNALSSDGALSLRSTAYVTAEDMRTLAVKPEKKGFFGRKKRPSADQE